MRSIVTPTNGSPRGAKGSANSNMKAREKKPLMAVERRGSPEIGKIPTGKGLGKAGAKRLGRLLKQVIIVPEEQQESSRRQKLLLPKTPFRLFKHHIQTEADCANTAKLASLDVPQLILSVVSHWKHQGGISMAELKQVLAARGYNITKTNRRKDVVTRRLVDNEAQADNKKVQTRSVKSPKQREDLEQRKKLANPQTGQTSTNAEHPSK